MNYKVSIIIPLFNREQLIIDTLESVKNQTYTNWEAIVVDDHSTDKSVNIVQKMVEEEPRIILQQRKSEDKGANACRNQGIEASTGDLVLFLDSDDLLEPDCLQNRVDIVKLDEQADSYTFPAVVFDDASGKLLDEFYYFDNDNQLLNAFLLRPQWHTSGSFTWRSKLEKWQLRYDETLTRWQDWKFHIDLIKKSSIISRSTQSQADVLIRSHNSGTRISQTQQVNYDDVFSVVKCLQEIEEYSAQPNGNNEYFIYRLFYFIQLVLVRKGAQILPEIYSSFSIDYSQMHFSYKWFYNFSKSGIQSNWMRKFAVKYIYRVNLFMFNKLEKQLKSES